MEGNQQIIEFELPVSRLGRRSLKVLRDLLDSTMLPPLSYYGVRCRLIALKESASIIRKLDKCDMVKVVAFVLRVFTIEIIYRIVHDIMKRRVSLDEIKSCLNLPHDISNDIDIWVLPYELLEEAEEEN